MKIYPYIQQHFFDLEPIAPKTSGYAAFVDVLGQESVFKISFSSPKEKFLLEEIIRYPAGFTYAQNGASRERTATRGALKADIYQFNIHINEQIDKKIAFEFKPSPLSIPQIEVTQLDKYWEARWVKAPNFSNYWIFALPEETYADYHSLFKKLHPITENKFNETNLKIEKNPFGKGQRYRVLVRANQEKEEHGFPRFSKESWGISSILV